MNAISVATAGMGSATAQLASAATQAANPTSNAGLLQSAIGQIEAQVAFAANASVVATADKMIGMLLDITA